MKFNVQQVQKINLDPILNELRDQREVQQQLRESIESLKVGGSVLMYLLLS